jgi:MarR family transcriptional regulator, transcriptional regulator for hemolysin
MESLAWDIAETAHALRRAFDRRASELGVTRAQWRVLGRLARRGGQRQVDLADDMDIEPITLCRIIDRLEDAGLVERRRDPGDRRAWQLFNTPLAEPLVTKLQALAESMEGGAFAGLGEAELAALDRSLAAIRSNVSHLEKAKVSA